MPPTAKHPKTDKPYTKTIYEPVLDLLQLLHQKGFATFIVSGGGVEFMCVFAEDVYDVPPEDVIGSTIKTHFEMRDATPVLHRDAALDFSTTRRASRSRSTSTSGAGRSSASATRTATARC